MSGGWRKSSAEGVAEGEFEVVDIQVATFAILALLTGLTTWYRPGGRLTKEAIVAAHEKLVLSSVAPGATPDAGSSQTRALPERRRRVAGWSADEVPMTERQPLDDIDLKILSELQRDGRIRNNELAERVGISEPPCRRRVRALRERGYVSAIRATLDETLLGYEVISFVLIQLQSQAQAPLQAFEKSIAAMPLVLQSWRISGDADYLLKCVARNVEGMHQQLLQFSAMPEVRNIRTFPVLGVAKDAPLPIPPTIRRHPGLTGIHARAQPKRAAGQPDEPQFKPSASRARRA